MHRNCFRRVLRLIERLSDDEGDRITHMLHRLLAKHGRMRDKALRAILVWQRRKARHSTQMRDIGRGQDQLHTLHAARGGEIANVEIGMRMRRAQNITDQRAIGLHIGDVLAIAGDELLVFNALEGLADAELLESHGDARFLNAREKSETGFDRATLPRPIEKAAGEMRMSGQARILQLRRRRQRTLARPTGQDKPPSIKRRQGGGVERRQRQKNRAGDMARHPLILFAHIDKKD